jgi:hypothetical protein
MMTEERNRAEKTRSVKKKTQELEKAKIEWERWM